MKRLLLVVLVLAGFASFVLAADAVADDAKVLTAKVNSTLEVFKATKGSDVVLNQAKGLLVFPAITKGGFVFGAQYGEGALLINGEVQGFYNDVGGSFGLQIGAQRKSVIIAFMDPAALERFQNASGWKVGVDASVAVVAVGADGSINTAKLNQPIIAFVFDQKGLMGNVTLEGAKITKIHKK